MSNSGSPTGHCFLPFDLPTGGAISPERNLPSLILTASSLSVAQPGVPFPTCQRVISASRLRPELLTSANLVSFWKYPRPHRNPSSDRFFTRQSSQRQTFSRSGPKLGSHVRVASLSTSDPPVNFIDSWKCGQSPATPLGAPTPPSFLSCLGHHSLPTGCSHPVPAPLLPAPRTAARGSF